MRISFKFLLGLCLVTAFVAGVVFPQVAGAAGQGVVAAPAPGGAITGPNQPPGPAGAQTMINPADFDAVVELDQKIEPYLYVDDAGLVQLRDVSADQLGVTDEFLANYREALDYANQTIRDGNIVVNDDMTVDAVQRLGGDFNIGLPGFTWGKGALPEADLGGLAGAAPDAHPSADGAAEPEWGAWGYPSGAIFYNSYSDWTYYRYSYYGLCSSMAAYLGLPWMSPSLVYFYGYNQPYLGRYVYNPMGVYYYMPYSYCQNSFGYKPGYFWTRSYMYNYGCGCYQYQWAWQGFWLRY